MAWALGHYIVFPLLIHLADDFRAVSRAISEWTQSGLEKASSTCKQQCAGIKHLEWIMTGWVGLVLEGWVPRYRWRDYRSKKRQDAHWMGIHMGLVDSQRSKCCSFLQFLLLMYQSCLFIKLFLVNSGVGHLRFDFFFSGTTSLRFSFFSCQM